MTTTPRPAAEAAEGTRPAGQAEAAKEGDDALVIPQSMRDALQAKVDAMDSEKVNRLWAALKAVGEGDDRDVDPSAGLIAYVEHPDGSHVSITPQEWAQAVRARATGGQVTDPKPTAGVTPVAGREASATVERRHREAALKALVPGLPDEIHNDWARLGDEGVGYVPVVASRIASALANAEAYGRASALEKP